jgi:hypothetical protein
MRRGHAPCAAQPRVRAAAALALAVVLLHCVAAQLETAGYAAPDAEGGAGPHVQVSDVLPDGTRCAEREEELAPLFAQTLAPDLAAWTHPPGAAADAPPVRYNVSAFQDFVAHGGANRMQLIMVHQNKWYYYAHENADFVVVPRAATPEDHMGGSVHPWVGAMHWWFEEAVTAWGWSFPGACARAPRFRRITGGRGNRGALVAAPACVRGSPRHPC